jgi:hypothetical protein
MKIIFVFAIYALLLILDYNWCNYWIYFLTFKSFTYSIFSSYSISSPSNQAIIKLKPHATMLVKSKNPKLGFKFPWWCLFLAYSLSLILISISILFIIARGIEFGELKSQKWLASILSGFFLVNRWKSYV